MALSKVKSGNIIFTSEPFAYALMIDEHERLCHYCCQRNKKLKTCTECRSSRYCSRTCQKKGWEDHHKRECKFLSKSILGVKIEWHIILMLRIILKLQDPSSKKHEVTLNGVIRHFDDLMTHKEELQKHETRTKLFRATVAAVETLIGPQNMLNRKECFEIFCKIIINAHFIESDVNGITEHVGVGLYLGGSAMNHSCFPTAASYCAGTKMVVVAIEDIEEPSFKNVNVDYINCRMTPTAQRKAMLKEGYYFDCQCRRCLDENLDKVAIAAAEMALQFLASNPGADTGDLTKKIGGEMRSKDFSSMLAAMLTNTELAENVQQNFSSNNKTQSTASSTSEPATDKLTIEAENANGNVLKNSPSDTKPQLTAPSTSEAATDKHTVEEKSKIPPSVTEDANEKLWQESKSDLSFVHQEKAVHLRIKWLQQQIHHEAEKHALQMKMGAQRLQIYEQRKSAYVQEERYWQEKMVGETSDRGDDDDDDDDYDDYSD